RRGAEFAEIRGEEKGKRDGNTEFTEIGTQRSRRREKRKRDPSAARPVAQECGAKEKVRPLRSLLRRAGRMTIFWVGVGRARRREKRPRLGRGPGTMRRRGDYSNFSCIWGNCSLALASDFTTRPSAFSAVRLRAVAISLTSRYLARSNIFFSRKDNGLLRLRETRLLRTTATSSREPVRMRSEFSLKRCFQS